MSREGFFDPAGLSLSRPVPLLPQCGACGLYKGCKSPKMPPSGKGRKRILIVGEAPGRNEDDEGIQFVGEAGQLLKSALAINGVDMRRDCWITNSLACRPPSNKIEDERMIGYCRPNVVKAIKDFEPETILLFGAAAVKSVIGWMWRESPGAIGRWIGWRIPCQKLNAWLCPIWHPSYINRTDYGDSRKENSVRRTIFERHLKRALLLKGRPWDKIPDYESKVVVTDAEHASYAIEGIIKAGKPTAFDYETNRLKPDGEGSQIICCSLSNGELTVAFPWMEPAVGRMKKFLESKVPKIASNLKFEHRWSLHSLGVRVRNWKWCTMTAAHVLDNRPDIAGIEFQAFVRLGQAPWDKHVAGYLESQGASANSDNRAKEVSRERLMLYCGMDSLMEWEVARVQQGIFAK